MNISSPAISFMISLMFICHCFGAASLILAQIVSEKQKPLPTLHVLETMIYSDIWSTVNGVVLHI